MKNTVMATADRDTVTGVSDGGVYHPPLPPDYELDDYWMNNIVLKDEKQAEDEFYSAWGRFSSKLNHPHPPYVAARIAAAPRYKPFSSLLLTKSRRNTDHDDDDVNVGVKRKRNNSDGDHHYYYLPSKASGDDQVIKKKPRLIFVFKGHKSTHSSNLSDVHQVKSVSRKTIPVAPATNGVPVLPAREMMIKNLITAKMGVCGSLTLVVSKKLTCTDLAQSQNRFSIPHRQVQNDFLTEEERKFLDGEPKPPSGCSTIEVELLILDQQNHLQPPYLDANEIKVRSLNLANWKTNSMYVLKTGWYSLVQQHQLQEGTSVQLWAFRNDGSELCFALLLLN